MLYSTTELAPAPLSLHSPTPSVCFRSAWFTLSYVVKPLLHIVTLFLWLIPAFIIHFLLWRVIEQQFLNTAHHSGKGCRLFRGPEGKDCLWSVPHSWCGKAERCAWQNRRIGCPGTVGVTLGILTGNNLGVIAYAVRNSDPEQDREGAEEVHSLPCGPTFTQHTSPGWPASLGFKGRGGLQRTAGSSSPLPIVPALAVPGRS